MHVLTKLFIVLVSLLAVMMVPLVVVYAANENSFKGKFQQAESKAFASQEAMKAAEARAGAEQSRLEREISDLRTMVAKLQTEKDGADVNVNQLRSQLASSESTQRAVTTDISSIRVQIETMHQLTESLINETRELRGNAVALEREKVELDEALRDVQSQLDVAEQARRALAEELARLKDEHSQALTDLGRAVAMGYNPKDDVRAGALRGELIPDKTLMATVLRVERSTGRVLAEIDAGSRDGVKEGWKMTIGDGGKFIANLQIINVDINRSTGVITLETKERGWVQVGHKAHAVAGQD